MAGTLEAGKWADLTVLDLDPLTVKQDRPESLLDGQILMTIVRGAVAFGRDDDE